MVLVKLSVEPSPVPSTDRGDTQPCEPRISHPPRVASPKQATPIDSQPRRSQPRTPDYEKAVDEIVGIDIDFDVSKNALVADRVLAAKWPEVDSCR